MALLTPEDIVRGADVVAIEPTRILQIAAKDLSTFIDSNPAVAKAIIADPARRLGLADERLVSILSGIRFGIGRIARGHSELGPAAGILVPDLHPDIDMLEPHLDPRRFLLLRASKRICSRTE